MGIHDKLELGRGKTSRDNPRSLYLEIMWGINALLTAFDQTGHGARTVQPRWWRQAGLKSVWELGWVCSPGLAGFQITTRLTAKSGPKCSRVLASSPDSMAT